MTVEYTVDDIATSTMKSRTIFWSMLKVIFCVCVTYKQCITSFRPSFSVNKSGVINILHHLFMNPNMATLCCSKWSLHLHAEYSVQCIINEFYIVLRLYSCVYYGCTECLELSLLYEIPD